MEVRMVPDGGNKTRVWIDGQEVTRRVRTIFFSHDDPTKRPALKIVMTRVDEVGNPITEDGKQLTETFEPWEAVSEDNIKGEQGAFSDGQTGTATKTNGPKAQGR